MEVTSVQEKVDSSYTLSTLNLKNLEVLFNNFFTCTFVCLFIADIVIVNNI